MQRNTDTHGTAPDGPATPTAMGDAAELAGTASPGTGGRVRARLVSGRRFARHLLEMVVGMAVLGVALAALGEPPGYANLFVQYGLMGVSMLVPMVAWMRYRGHSWSDGGEMAAAMLLPMFALVVPVEFGVSKYVPGPPEDSLMMLSHVAMIGGMVVLMIYRFERYAHVAHGHRS